MLEITRKVLYNSFFIFFLSFLFLLSPLNAQEETLPDVRNRNDTHNEVSAANNEVSNTSEKNSSHTELTQTGADTHAALSRSEIQRIEMEIKTSTLSELAVWCRILGLSEGGTRNDLSNRIRNHFSIPDPGQQNNDNNKVITIESAQTTEYFTIDIIDEDYARLKGEVSIILKDGDSIHKISANEILFNRSRNIITAKGGVIYEKIEDDKTETFRGENITVNIDNWSSVFLDGRSTIENGGTSYLFSGLVITRTADDVTILRDAQVSSGANDEAFWSINASRLWLLPGSDFAIFNAWLKVGEIPVLYIPFFFFPTDELIFHPVIGYRTREGGFVQTTSYILGRPKADAAETNSLSRILGNSNDMQKERQGLFLRNTGKKYVPVNEITLKAIADYYVNLGFIFGIDFSLPKTGILNPLNLSLGLGFTRTVTDTSRRQGTNLGESPYWPDYDGTFDWNKSNLFSFQVPFRYRLNTNSSITGKYGSISWTLPLYSDPYVDRDFGISTRTESMDWINMLQQGAATEETSSSITEVPSYQWVISGNLTPSFTLLSPFISKASLTNISMTMSFIKFIDNTVSGTNPDSPSRSFFGPDKFTLYSVSGSITGNPLSLGGATTTAKTSTEQVEIEDPLRGIGTPVSPWENSSAPKQERNTSTEIIKPPELKQTFALPRAGNARFSIDYQLSPAASSELQFMNSNWKTYEEVNWNEVQSILSSFGTDASLNFRMEHSSGLYSNVVTFTGKGTWRDYSFLNEEFFINPIDGTVDEKKMDEARQNQYRQTSYSSSYSYTGSIKPLINNQIFGQSNFQYSLRGTLVRSKRYIDGNGPELTPQWGSWVKEEKIDGEDILGLNTHQLSANIAANIINNNQSISISAALPPLDELISTNATFRFWISETSISFRMERPKPPSPSQPLEPDVQDKDWIFKPIDIRETLRFGSIGSLAFSMTLDPETDNEITALRTDLSLKQASLGTLNINFQSSKVVKYVFNPRYPDRPSEGGEWIQEGEPSLYPTSLNFSYNKTFKEINIIRNRFNINFNLNSNLRFDLQRYTNSNFVFTMSFTLKITDFLDLTLSAKSDNSVIFRYFKNIPGMEDLTKMYAQGPQNNLFTDLFDSFNFSDDEKRKRSGFKMQSFNLDIKHYLGDWTAEFKLNMYPYQRTNAGAVSISIISDITFLVTWTPITEIKSDIFYDGKNEKWKVQ